MRTVSSTPKPAEDKPAPAEPKPKGDEPEEGELDEAADGPDGAEKAAKKKTGKAPRKALGKKSKGERKRGPARPYRKLPQETLESRIKKLEKRIERTSAQAEEGRCFLSKYTREQGFRDTEMAQAPA
jgi:hypothetical protein